MSNIYLKVTIEKNRYSQRLDILSLKSSSSGRFWRAPAHADMLEFSNFLL